MTKQTSNIYALLIGADFYFPNRLSSGGQFRSLGGCVRDINRVETELLHGRLQLPKENILKLAASVGYDNTRPVEPPEMLPTYKNIVKKFAELTEMAQAGDQVYIHYAGHGGRIKTKFPKLKGNSTEYDETLVPIDIGNKTTRYVRDLDLACILKRMVDKGLIVTLVLDSCHSGGATRNGGGNDVATRTATGGSVVDETERPTDSEVGSDEELIAAWQIVSNDGTRNASLGAGWLPEPEGYVLLAACRESESALEYAFNGKDRCGVMTYWLLDTLKQSGTHLTWKQVHERIFAKVHSQFSSQTPQVQGDINRVVFGANQIQSQHTVFVMDADKTQEGIDRVRLNTGQALGVSTDAVFALYSASETQITATTPQLATARITELGATDSWAIVESEENKEIKPGDKALLIDAVTVKRKVRLLADESHLQNEHKAALKAIETEIQLQGRGFVEMASQDDAVDYQVAVAEGENIFEILDPQGEPFANLRPMLEAKTSNAAEVTKRLVHLCRFHIVLQLQNFDSLSRLAGKIHVELFNAPKNYNRGDKPNPQKMTGAGNTPTINEADTLFLHIKNNAEQVLNICVLDLQPDWGISQIYPPPNKGDYVSLDPGKELWEALKFSLPSGHKSGMDTLKVFGTIGATTFRWLELPALNSQRNAEKKELPAKPRNVLEEMMCMLRTDENKFRNVVLSVEASDEWTVSDVSVNIVKNL